MGAVQDKICNSGLKHDAEGKDEDRLHVGRHL